MGSRAGAVVRARASLRCGPGSLLSSDHMWTKFVVGSLSALFFPRVFRISPQLKNQHFLIPIRRGMLVSIIHEPLARETGQPLLALILNIKLDRHSERGLRQELERVLLLQSFAIFWSRKAVSFGALYALKIFEFVVLKIT